MLVYSPTNDKECIELPTSIEENMKLVYDKYNRKAQEIKCELQNSHKSN